MGSHSVTCHLAEVTFSPLPQQSDPRVDSEQVTAAEICDCVTRTCARCLHPLTHFFRKLNKPRFSASMDVYAPMFFCDLVTFLIVVFGYDKFGPSVNLLTFNLVFHYIA